MGPWQEFALLICSCTSRVPYLYLPALGRTGMQVLYGTPFISRTYFRTRPKRLWDECVRRAGAFPLLATARYVLHFLNGIFLRPFLDSPETQLTMLTRSCFFVYPRWPHLFYLSWCFLSHSPRCSSFRTQLATRMHSCLFDLLFVALSVFPLYRSASRQHATSTRKKPPGLSSPVAASHTLSQRPASYSNPRFRPQPPLWPHFFHGLHLFQYPIPRPNAGYYAYRLPGIPFPMALYSYL